MSIWTAKARIIVLLCCLALLPACKRHQEKQVLREMLRAFENSAIVFPEQMKEYNYGEEQLKTIPEGYKFIVYLGPGECSSCALNHMDFSPALTLGKELGYTTLAIVSPNPEDLNKVRADLLFRFTSIPVLLDEDFSFREHNTCIPEDSRFHRFLVNPEGKPIFVGNSTNPAQRALLRRIMLESSRHTPTTNDSGTSPM